MYGAEKVVCGYAGGDEINPTYELVKKQQTGHRETIAVYYDDNKLDYKTLLEIYFKNIDPFDEGGQFIDRGFSYTLAIYTNNKEERDLALNYIDNLEKETNKKVYVSIEDYKNFYEAEEYHQDYYLKNPDAFEKELIESGRKK